MEKDSRSAVFTGPQPNLPSEGREGAWITHLEALKRDAFPPGCLRRGAGSPRSGWNGGQR